MQRFRIVVNTLPMPTKRMRPLCLFPLILFLSCQEAVPNGTKTDEIVLRISNQLTTSINTVSLNYYFYYGLSTNPSFTKTHSLTSLSPKTAKFLVVDATTLRGISLTKEEADANFDLIISNYKNNRPDTVTIWTLADSEPSYFGINVTTDSIFVETPKYTRTFKN